MSFLKPSTPDIPLPAQPTAPPPVLAPQGTKSGGSAKNQRSTFLGASDIANPSSGFGSTGPSGASQQGKSLLGQ